MDRSFYIFPLKRIKQQRINKAIREYTIQLVTEDGPPKTMSIEEALALAEEMSMDLVEINPNAKPVMCKIMDYGKFLYKKKKQEQEAKKKHKPAETKTIRFGFRTSDHDLNVRCEQAKGFLEKGNMVKVQVMGRGRELAYKDLALKKVEKFVDNLKDVATVDTLPKMNGNIIIAILKPQK